MLTRTFELDPALSLNDVENRLTTLSGYKLKDSSATQVTAHVGNSLKYRMLGVLLTDNYLAPVEVRAEKSETGSILVTLQQAGKFVGNFGEKNRQFYQRSYSQIEEALSA